MWIIILIVELFVTEVANSLVQPGEHSKWNQQSKERMFAAKVIIKQNHRLQMQQFQDK